MADSYTPNYGWVLPEIGASRDTWGQKLSANISSLDTLLFMAMPIGTVVDYCGSQPPSGWMVADGRLISRTTYAALFAAIGTFFGAGDGSTTFALPNFIGRSGVGPGTMTDQGGQQLSLTFAQAIGFVWNTITQATLPNYNLVTDVQGYHAHGGATAPGGNHNHATDAQGAHAHGGATSTAVQDHTHTGYTDGQGSHAHYTTLYGFANAAAGSFGVMTTAAGAANYYTSTDGYHGHAVQTYGSSTGSYQLGISVDGTHGHNISYSGNLQLGIYPDGNHQHTASLGGGGGLFEVLNPILVITKIIYAGTQAATRVAAQEAPAMTIDHEPLTEIEELREEVAQLRALLMPNTRARPRLLAAPMRGMH